MARARPGPRARGRARPGGSKPVPALLSLVVLSALGLGWTAVLVENAGPTHPPVQVPEGFAVPAAPVDEPASLSAVPSGAPRHEGIRLRALMRTAASASQGEIPSGALAAYQRAAAVVDVADPDCSLPWALLAAVGRVESDHGRAGGSSLDASGRARPAIYGVALDGTRRTAQIRDTDGGALDHDAAFDRAVGPMQFIPSTWSVVGVDGDGDGQRDPQDVDDAALAAAVHLCAGEETLDSEPGRRTALHRYNPSDEYVDLVLAVMAAYVADGPGRPIDADQPRATLVAVGPATGAGGPRSAQEPGTSLRAGRSPSARATAGPTVQTKGPKTGPSGPRSTVATAGSTPGSGTGSAGGTPGSTPGGTQSTQGTANSSEGTAEPTGKAGPTRETKPSATPSSQPTRPPSSPPTPPAPTLPAAPGTLGGTVLTYARAQALCLREGVPADQAARLAACVRERLAP